MSAPVLFINALALVIVLASLIKLRRMTGTSLKRLGVSQTGLLLSLFIFIAVNGAAVLFLSKIFGMVAAFPGLVLAVNLSFVPSVIARLLSEAATSKERRVQLELANYDLERKLGEARHVESALREIEGRFRRLTDHADDMIFVYNLDPQPHFGYVNLAIAKVLEITPEDCFADPYILSQMVRSEERSLLERALSPQLTKPTETTLQWTKAGGQPVRTEARFRPMFDHNGKVASVEANIRDITQTKAAEEARDKERRWLSAVFENAPVGMILMRLDERNQEQFAANRRTVELFGKDLDWEKGRRAYVGQFCYPNGNPVPFEQLPSSRALRGEMALPQEVTVRRRDGQQVALLASAAPIFDTDGKLEGIVGGNEDITVIRELERLREEWTAVVAHDLRQPISAIMMQGQLLSKFPGASAPLQRIGGHIQSSAGQLNRLVGDLLDASRLEAKNLRLDKSETDMKTLIENLLERLQPQFPERPIRLKIVGDSHRIPADPGRLEQILTNLITNAVKYGYPATAIELDLESTDSECRISVSNEGRGIPKDDIGRMFSRFQRAEWAKKEKIKGIGLGLYITRGLVDAHGGDIRVRSEPGRTTTFELSLPKKVDEAVDRQAG